MSVLSGLLMLARSCYGCSQRYGGLRPAPCWLCTGRAGLNPPVMRCPVSSYRLLIGPFALPLSPDIVRAATPFFPRLFRTFPVIALAWVLVPVTGRLPSKAFHSGQALFYFEIGTPKNTPDVCRRLTLSQISAKSLHSVGRTIPKASFLPGTAGQTWGLLTVPSFSQRPWTASRTVCGRSLVNRLTARIAHQRLRI